MIDPRLYITISDFFQVNPSETYLRDEIDGTTYFPLQDGSFNLLEEGVMPYATLLVEGRSLDATVRNNHSTANTSGASTNHSLSLSSTPISAATVGRSPGGVQSASLSGPAAIFRSVIASKRVQTFNLKLVKARMSRIGRKTEFQPLHQTFIELIDTTANVEHILAIARRQWGLDYILVTQDGLQIEDSPATQGIDNYISV